MRKIAMKYGKPGSSPAHLIESVTANAEESRLHWVRYHESSFSEEEAAPLGEVLEGMSESKVDWLHFDHVPEPAALRWLQEKLGLDPLAVEDVHNGNQRTKLERFEGHSFIVVSVPVMQDGQVVLEQLSLFLGPHWVISVWPGEPGIVEPVRERLRSGGTGRIRKRGTDYLIYSLIDSAVDSAFPVLDSVRESVEDLEEAMLESADERALSYVRQTRRNIITLKRLSLPGQETYAHLTRADDSPLTPQTRRYMRDVLDHHMRIADTAESLSEIARNMHELYLASLSHRMNDVMKLLTMIATIFIPLSFVTGLYGMNFNPEASPWNMPELNTRFGYPAVLLLLAIVAGIMLWVFRRRDWL